MRPTSRLVRKLVRRESGAAMVEFALVAPLLILLASGVIDLGRAFKQYNTLSQAVRDGARFAATHPKVATATLATRVRARVDSTFRDEAGASKPSTNASLTCGSPPLPAPADDFQYTVTVTSYAYDPLTPFIPASALQFTASAVFRKQDAPLPCL
jgi:Flp pilus assembly protein TadG